MWYVNFISIKLIKRTYRVRNKDNGVKGFVGERGLTERGNFFGMVEIFQIVNCGVSSETTKVCHTSEPVCLKGLISLHVLCLNK